MALPSNYSTITNSCSVIVVKCNLAHFFVMLGTNCSLSSELGLTNELHLVVHVGTRQLVHLDELTALVCLERRTKLVDA